MQVEDKPDVTYEQVGGMTDELDQLREVVEVPLLNPERFLNLGIDPPKGVLLYGPPGTFFPFFSFFLFSLRNNNNNSFTKLLISQALGKL